MTDLLGVGVSGLLSFQRALGTTSNNIINANTPGFSRQEISLSTRTPYLQGGQYIGSGVSVENITRAFDELSNDQLRQQISAFKEYSTFLHYAEQIDSTLADPERGLSMSLNQFFNICHNLANNPASIPNRQMLLTQGELVTDQFHRMYSTMSDIKETVNQEMSRLADSINTMSHSIAKMNIGITESIGAGSGAQPNDLLDKRNELVKSLSELIDIRAVDDKGALTIFLNTGDTLVLGGQVSEVSAGNDPQYPENKVLQVQIGSEQRPLDDRNLGGQVGGIVRFRNEILNNTTNAIGRLAIGLSTTINLAHQRGMDLNGQLGQAVFNDLHDSNAIQNERNNGNATLAVQINTINEMNPSDYELVFNGQNFIATRLKDNIEVGEFPPGTFDMPSEGLTVTTTGTPKLGDKFILTPYKSAAKNISLNNLNPAQIATALPISINPNNNNVGLTNGRLVIEDVSQSSFSTSPGTLSPPLLIQYTSATQYDIYDNSTSGAPVLLYGGQSFIPGQENALLPSAMNAGYQLYFDGNLENGDQFSVNYNSGGTTDNRNALILSEIQNQSLFDQQTVSLKDAYGQLVAEVGNRTHQASMNTDATDSLVKQAQLKVDTVSGVNLDEEAANLLMYEQAYRAASQVIGVTSKLFDSLLNTLR